MIMTPTGIGRRPTRPRLQSAYAMIRSCTLAHRIRVPSGARQRVIATELGCNCDLSLVAASSAANELKIFQIPQWAGRTLSWPHVTHRYLRTSGNEANFGRVQISTIECRQCGQLTGSTS
jgi:hypothetical protein